MNLQELIDALSELAKVHGPHTKVITYNGSPKTAYPYEVSEVKLVTRLGIQDAPFVQCLLTPLPN